jgi:hypothetical protein
MSKNYFKELILYFILLKGLLRDFKSGIWLSQGIIAMFALNIYLFIIKQRNKKNHFKNSSLLLHRYKV